jgi:hypothetical protein
MITSELKKNGKDRELNEFQKLLANPDEAKYVNMAKLISPHGKVVQRETDLGIKLTKDRLTSKHNPTFTKDEIKAECLKFNMTFVRGIEYKGDWSPELMKKLEAFLALEKNKGLLMAEYDYSRKLYVMAPMDNTNKDTLGAVTNCKDPLLFIETVGEHYYTMIDGEKNYVNLLNRWQGFKNKSAWNARWAYTTENYLLIWILGFIITKLTGFPGLSPFYLLWVAPIAFVIASIRMCFRASFEEPFTHGEEFYNPYKFRNFTRN